MKKDKNKLYFESAYKKMLNSAPIDKKAALSAISRYYAWLGHKIPPIYWASSIVEACIVIDFLENIQKDWTKDLIPNLEKVIKNIKPEDFENKYIYGRTQSILSEQGFNSNRGKTVQDFISNRGKIREPMIMKTINQLQQWLRQLGVYLYVYHGVLDNIVYKVFNKKEPPYGSSRNIDKLILTTKEEYGRLLDIRYRIRNSIMSNSGANSGYDVPEGITSCKDGQLDFNWIEYMKFFKPKDLSSDFIYNIYENLANACHLWYPYNLMAIVIERPIVLMRNGELHNENGPAIQYPDGCCLYYMEGVHVPPWLANESADEIDVKDILENAINAEVRRVAFKKCGIEKLLKHGNSIAKQNGYELINLDRILGRMRSCPYLVMKNPSTGDTHIEGVHPECRTIQQALNWRASGDLHKNWNPIILS